MCTELFLCQVEEGIGAGCRYLRAERVDIYISNIDGGVLSKYQSMVSTHHIHIP
jgi:hypothetical protein